MLIHYPPFEDNWLVDSFVETGTEGGAGTGKNLKRLIGSTRNYGKIYFAIGGKILVINRNLSLVGGEVGGAGKSIGVGKVADFNVFLCFRGSDD